MTREDKLLKEYEEKLLYYYAKANTKSKRKRILYDLFNFSSVCYEHFDIKKNFPWEDDIEMLKLYEDLEKMFITNTFKNKEFYFDISSRVINTYVDLKYPFYTDYCRLIGSLSPLQVEELTFDFLNNYDSELLNKYKDKIRNCELFDDSIYGKTGFSGLTYPFEYLKKSLIFIDDDSSSVASASIVMHEFGHSFEYDIMYKCGVDNYLPKISKLPYSEVASRFFEYAFLNYLKENKIYENDVDICLSKYFKTMLVYMYEMNLICKMKNLNINEYGYAVIDEQELSIYAKVMQERLNYYYSSSDIGEEINYNHAFLYGIGSLFSIYLYDNYKENKTEFKKEFVNALINYQYNDIEAFTRVGITKEKLVEGKILKRTLSSMIKGDNK